MENAAVFGWLPSALEARACKRCLRTFVCLCEETPPPSPSCAASAALVIVGVPLMYAAQLVLLPAALACVLLLFFFFGASVVVVFDAAPLQRRQTSFEALLLALLVRLLAPVSLLLLALDGALVALWVWVLLRWYHPQSPRRAGRTDARVNAGGAGESWERDCTCVAGAAGALVVGGRVVLAIASWLLLFPPAAAFLAFPPRCAASWWQCGPELASLVASCAAFLLSAGALVLIEATTPPYSHALRTKIIGAWLVAGRFLEPVEALAIDEKTASVVLRETQSLPAYALTRTLAPVVLGLLAVAYLLLTFVMAVPLPGLVMLLYAMRVLVGPDFPFSFGFIGDTARLHGLCAAVASWLRVHPQSPLVLGCFIAIQLGGAFFLANVLGVPDFALKVMLETLLVVRFVAAWQPLINAGFGLLLAAAVAALCTYLAWRTASLAAAASPPPLPLPVASSLAHLGALLQRELTSFTIVVFASESVVDFFIGLRDAANAQRLRRELERKTAPPRSIPKRHSRR